ncbi:phospho ribosylglycinamide formyltransferase [Companilactobacillus nodensis DSM 19682 = JCM 14932 = NBRC 107160]|uniref:Phosphoribosylglycinamide formyltransferase n=1 Tax=Companilactobacillus nodensis DSM 19682 = JCM 14932 = NBRC 107160 TaxID=1423775 RepID=A0A0R1K975_9LACO|nr:phosphoribosylglycinamide formyltransferase [Companilactobacillus nodensis]KRK80012.1 phospho ribosylglycinamide formyltransferase [Companilactobacillus nodensis DSM 19682 = JCM 14932 = NBRC 107160]
MRVAIFASGNGTNFDAIANSTELQEAGLDIEVLVCDQPNAPVIQKAKNLNIPVFVNELKNFPNRKEYERTIVDKLVPFEVEYIFLAGYMRVVTSELLNEYRNRIINIHPSLLPKFSGLDAIQRAFDSGDTETGVTIHYIDENVDTGPIICQKYIPILKTDNVETLEERIHTKEHEMYIKVILDLIKKESENVNFEKGID